jgi:ATP-dependent DNA helicase RecQ
VLLGKDTARIRKFGHDRVSTFGIGKELKANQWKSVYRQLVAAGMAAVDVEGFGGLRLTEAADRCCAASSRAAAARPGTHAPRAERQRRRSRTSPAPAPRPRPCGSACASAAANWPWSRSSRPT